MSQTNVREGYGITTLEVVELIEDLTSYLLKSLRSLTSKDWLAVAKCTRLRNAQISKIMMLAKVRQYGAKVKTEDLSNTLTPTLSETAQRQSSSVVSNRSTASITDKFGVASLTKPAILNDANVALVDAVHHSVQKLEENYFEVRAQHLKYDALIQHLSLPKYSDWYQDDDDLLGTVNSHIKLRRLRAPLLPKKRGRHSKLILDGPPLKRRKTEAADSRHAKASGGRTKKDKDSEDSDTGSDVPRLRRRDRAAARAQSAERKRLGKEAQLKKTRDEEELAKAKKEKEEKELTDAYILYFKELSSDNGGIFANAIGMGKTRAMVLATEVQNARAEGDAIEHNAVDDDDKLCPTEGERTFYCADPLALRFCFFSNSPPENMGRLTKEEAIEMRIDTTDAISKALAAANKLVALRSYVLGGATKHRLAPLAARFVIVCGFGKVDKHVFRAYNTMSVTAQRTIIRKGGPYVEKRAILLPGHVTVWGRTVFDEFHNCKSEGTIIAKKGVSNWFNATNKRDSVTSDRIYKMEDARNMIANVKHDASEHESSHKYKELISQGAAVAQRFMLKRTLKTRDPWGKLISGIKGDFLPYFQSCPYILEKEGLDESEASRRVIFNRFEMQAIASYPALATLKAAQFKTYGSRKVKRFTLNSVKDLFTNLSKDYFLVREARAITKSSLKFQNLLNLCSELAEMCVGIVYFNSDSELELKVLGKQDVKTTSRDKLQGGGSTVTD
ncbi:hypothetical protein HBH53_239650 [Parastagonospora nodorum]|nr:hypothetical protein HBH53_239650 [Parastagonospora nodorum]